MNESRPHHSRYMDSLDEDWPERLVLYRASRGMPVFPSGSFSRGFRVTKVAREMAARLYSTFEDADFDARLRLAVPDPRTTDEAAAWVAASGLKELADLEILEVDIDGPRHVFVRLRDRRGKDMP